MPHRRGSKKLKNNPLALVIVGIMALFGSCFTMFNRDTPTFSTFSANVPTIRQASYQIAAVTMTARRQVLTSGKQTTQTLTPTTVEIPTAADTPQPNNTPTAESAQQALVQNAAVAVPPTSIEDRWGVIQADVLNVRAGPGTEHPVITQVRLGDCLRIGESTGGWLKVLLVDEQQGWCFGEYIELVPECPALDVAPSIVTFTEQPEPVSASIVQPTYVVRPFVPNARTTGEGWIHECFGSGESPLRLVASDTPVEVLGKGGFTPPDNQRAQLGNGPFLKVRLWDGQFAWAIANNVGVDVAAVPLVSSVCEEYDRIDWSTTRPTPTTVPFRLYESPQSQPARSCCRVCSAGKACGDSCISRSYTCHKGPGCACNG